MKKDTEEANNFFEGEFNPTDFEERILQFWEENKIFEKSLAKNPPKTQNLTPNTFTFYDGPPFATGLPHYGHLLASTIKDLIPRYQTMRGRYVRRRWGWDCHGLPIEEIVERKLKISGKKQIEELGIKKFNETCRSMVLQFADEWKKTIRRIARWVEFDNSYKTMDFLYMESVWWAFKQIYEKGLIYEGRKVLLYCPRCETPVSNFEVAMDNSYKDVTDTAVTAKFKLKINNPTRQVTQIGNHEFSDIYILAWTTTPWTLPANVALAVGKDILYSVTEKNGQRLLVAGDSPAGKELGHTGVQVRGSELVGLEYEPLFDAPEIKSHPKSHRVYGADFVNTEDGTGIVHTAVMYGEDDYTLGLREGLPTVPLLDEKGKFNDKAPEIVRGQYFKDADKIVVADLEKRGLLFKAEQYTHSYPHCWRCGNPLFYNAIPSWFMNIQKIKTGLLKSNAQEMNWFPAHLKHGRYEKSVEQAPDWNISRNRYWGNPMPVWKCSSNEQSVMSNERENNCGNVFVAGSVQDLKEKSVARNTYLFSRHGESDNLIMGITGPHKDTPELTCHLTEKGKKQIEKLAAGLKKRDVDVIIASPLARTKETAEIFSKATGAPISYRDDLVDINSGIFYGKLSEEHKSFMKDKDAMATPPPEGESRLEARRRMLAAFREIDAVHEGKKILIVGHGDPLWLLKSALEGIPREAIEQIAYPVPGELYSINTRPLPLNDDGDLDLHRPYIDEIFLACEKCGGTMRRTTEVFDSWVEAGSMPFAELHYPFENKELFHERFPAQFVVEYIAQTRAWFYVMHALSFVLFGHAPVQSLVTTGTILAEDGSKMSKSKNNYPDPWLVLEKYGADALRFYLANSVVMQADNVNFSERDVQNVYRKVLLIWKNVVNYYETYAPKAQRAISDEQSVMSVLDRWIMVRTQELVNAVTGGLDAYDTVRATRAMAEYINDLSTWYLRRSRGRTDEAFFATLREALLTSAKVMAPVMPYMAEAVYQAISYEPEATSTNSVHLADWPEVKELSSEEESLLKNMETVRNAASVGQALRKEAGIPVRQVLNTLKIRSTKSEIRNNNEMLEILKEELNVKQIIFDSTITNEIELDTELTPELRREGLVRGLERAIQDLRKKQGFKVGEKARLVYATSDKDIVAALKSFNKEKTYIAEAVAGALSGEHLELDGKKFSLALERA